MNTVSLVTGATGFLGSHLVETLTRQGHRVRCLVRRTSDLAWLSAQEVDLVHGRLDDPEALARAVSGTDYIFHCAGAIRARNLQEYREANAAGSRRLAEAAANFAKSLKRFVQISSLAAAGPAPSPHPVDELTPCRPVSDYGISKLEGEQAVMDFGHVLPVTVIRPPVIFGPRDRGVLNFFKLARLGWIPNLGGTKLFSIVYVRDLVEGIVQAARSEPARGRTYFLSNDMAVGFEEMLLKLGGLIGTRMFRRVYLRTGMLMALASANHSIMTWMGKSTFFNPDKVREMEQEFWICSNARARSETGFVPKVSLDEGLRETAAWYRQARWL